MCPFVCLSYLDIDCPRNPTMSMSASHFPPLTDAPTSCFLVSRSPDSRLVCRFRFSCLGALKPKPSCAREKPSHPPDAGTSTSGARPWRSSGSSSSRAPWPMWGCARSSGDETTKGNKEHRDTSTSHLTVRPLCFLRASAWGPCTHSRRTVSMLRANAW